MDEKRVYGRNVVIDTSHIHEFYEKRAAIEDASAVLLGNVKSVDEKNKFDREEILPKLGITKATRVLDIGCGIGRMAEMVLPRCGFYYGVDFSESMVNATEKVCQGIVSKGGFECRTMSFSDVLEHDPDFFGGKFGAVLVLGVCVYINDDELRKIFSTLNGLLDDTCTLYFAEPIGLGERLSLVDFPSRELHTDYSAIYRTAEEYTALYAPLLDAGFSIVEQNYSPRFGETYTDTGRWYTILKR